jgi:hypothetical protein
VAAKNQSGGSSGGTLPGHRKTGFLTEPNISTELSPALTRIFQSGDLTWLRSFSGAFSFYCVGRSLCLHCFSIRWFGCSCFRSVLSESRSTALLPWLRLSFCCRRACLALLSACIERPRFLGGRSLGHFGLEPRVQELDMRTVLFQNSWREGQESTGLRLVVLRSSFSSLCAARF